MADIEWRRSERFLRAFGREFAVTCQVRNELNGLRVASNIFRTTTERGEPGVPSQPRPFPLGTWRVYRPIHIAEGTNRYLEPYYIPTNAHQLLEEWVVVNGAYMGKSGRQVDDFAYGLHFSQDTHTQGCIKFDSREDLLVFVDALNAALNQIADPNARYLLMEVMS